ncbi:MAG: type I-C CRISPR-associated protein Cas7/Csd2 [Candidatus Thiodiazotropha sp. (ex Ustalcina ferruginea)]|nr:type I-C CRISPR-associated protein Cas7/Csd2 [Candidatus Thiodiazotropha sp. (ex Ustalcina ferruginea)]
MSLQNKIDFALIFSVNRANPNGDPLNGNRPRTDYDGFGEVSDVCLKRKIRDRLQDAGEQIFVQSDEKKTDGMPNLRARAKTVLGKDALKVDKKNPSKKEEIAKHACKEWIDVRSFGQLFAFGKGGDDASGVSIPIRGPVSIQSAFSIEPVSITSTQIVKSVNAEEAKGKSDISSDRMGMKHRVDRAVYVAFGGMTPQLAERTGFNNEDAEKIKKTLPKLFEGDASSARPEGSMVVEKLIWWEHNCRSGQHSSAKVHRTLNVNPDGSYTINHINGLTPEEIPGF